MKITVIGTGYVGLVTGTCLANTGLNVTCVDINEDKINQLNNSKIPFYEPGLEELLSRNIKAERLSFTSDTKAAVAGAEAVFLAVGTPMGEDGSADLKYLLAAAKDVAIAATSDLLMVTKSTVPVGSGQKLKNLVKQHSKYKIVIASNPEFLKEGDAVNDFLKPDRIIIGTDDIEAKEILNKIYRPFMMREFRVIHMDIKSAELTKYAANGMLATRISFMNDIANLCEKVGANVDLVRQGMATDPRIGSSFLYPGVGYGGSCFPKDVQALVHIAEEVDHSLDILKAVDKVNTKQRAVMLQKLHHYFKGDLKGKTIAIWGLAFKPRTDDIREAPSILLIEGLLSAGVKVRAFDRAAMPNTRAHFAKKNDQEQLKLLEDEYSALDGADALVLMTEWPEFRAPSWREVKDRLHANVVFDGRNIYQATELRKLGFKYFGIGRP